MGSVRSQNVSTTLEAALLSSTEVTSFGSFIEDKPSSLIPATNKIEKPFCFSRDTDSYNIGNVNIIIIFIV